MMARFPIIGGLSISWIAAETAYMGYARLYGDSQSLARIAERGGFGVLEFVRYVLAGRASTLALAKAALREALDDRVVATILANAQICASS